jgi:hypothetical protein
MKAGGRWEENGGCLQVKKHDQLPHPNLWIFIQHYPLIKKKKPGSLTPPF